MSNELGIHPLFYGANQLPDKIDSTDSQILLDTLKFVQDIGRTPPFSDLVTLQTTPELSEETDEELIGYNCNFIMSNSGADECLQIYTRCISGMPFLLGKISSSTDGLIKLGRISSDR